MAFSSQSIFLPSTGGIGHTGDALVDILAEEETILEVCSNLRSMQWIVGCVEVERVSMISPNVTRFKSQVLLELSLCSSSSTTQNRIFFQGHSTSHGNPTNSIDASPSDCGQASVEMTRQLL